MPTSMPTDLHWHYTEEQIGKLWSGNLLRVWGDVEKVAPKLQKEKG